MALKEYQKQKCSFCQAERVQLRIAHLSSRTMAYMEVLTVDAFILSKRFVSVSITHRIITKRVAVAGSSSKQPYGIMARWSVSPK
nr:hypothetical protein [Tanacetum cinerariifolium]